MSRISHALALGGLAAAALAAAAPAGAQPAYGDRPYGDHPYDGRPYDDDPRRLDHGPFRPGPVGPAVDLVGPGVPLLVPPLRDTPRGRAWVARRFDLNHDGVIQPWEARAANDAFRARRGWDDDREVVVAPPPPPPPPGPAYGWDRPAMHAYGFRQNRYGAVFNLSDVLFETGSARLRPSADAKLRPLAGYLRSHPAQRLRIDGFTDSVGTAQANLILSRDRARSVADALAALGVDPARFQLEGHGEDSPVASNATAEGRQLNRRVEVTLVGARASSF